ncbi:hypothetical protein [Spiroplasma turonicum]|uniref:Uncharacterized protein n=1 Tax=Spiroplasma turonicum TaxID=216946 RepID=A0A0K1P4S1_9MOLU|nr:hypothetical protein [Spiroplasma turonicum]AKU79278.1 hypothetical protein STURON_0032 [Spiroplasma turonicum]ALX70301.1 hypothetical protein STURO_v1c00320 [Spiroplasma turonicum]
MQNIYFKTKSILSEIVDQKFKNKINESELTYLKNILYKTVINEHRKLSFLQLDVDDFIHTVYKTLIEVDEKYDKETKIPLPAYANYILKKRILDYAKFLRRNKRLATIEAINSNRGEMFGSYISNLDKDLDIFSFNNYNYIKTRQDVRIILNTYLNSNADSISKKVAVMIYEGHSQKEIMETLNISRRKFLIIKENLKKYFNSLIN